MGFYKVVTNDILMNGKTKGVSSLGIKYPTNRDNSLHTGDLWLEGKRADEGAEGLWRIHDELYDLSEFVESHPGGSEWLRLTKGTDITEAFEAHHIHETAAGLLPKYFSRKASAPRNYPFTYHENGFYRTLKRRIRKQIVKIPNKYAKQSQIMADCLFACYVISAWLATFGSSLFLGVISGVLLSYSAVASHNFFHQRDNFRMYYFDFTMMASREWRISHALSHHLYTNTINDLEISALEPWFYWMPFKKNMLMKYGSWIYAPLVYISIFFGHWIKCSITHIKLKGYIPLVSFLPFSIVVLTYLTTGQTLSHCIGIFLWIIAASSVHFSIVGVNAAHHHPMIFHDGDTPRPKEEMDFGVFQMDAVADRKDINGSPFLVLTHFGDHALHHLFPTIDHGKLKFLYSTFKETCEEFGVEWKCTSQLELAKGQYQQLSRDFNKKPPKALKKIEINNK